MLSEAVWKDAALRANLKIGMRRRFGHDCGPGDVVLVTAEVQGLSAWCFRCGEGATVRRELSLNEKVQQLRARGQAEAEFKKCQLPFDYTLDIPPQHALWLYKASIRKAQARELGIGWSPSLHRIILPVYTRDGELAYVQARAVDFPRQTPKYLNSSGTGAGRTLFQTRAITPETPFVVVTEDMLSAVRCGAYGAAAALCGVSVNEYKAVSLVEAKQILCWLDPDPAGQKGMRKLMKFLSLMHPDVRTIHSEKDPKFLTNEQIRRHIDAARNNAA